MSKIKKKLIGINLRRTTYEDILTCIQNNICDNMTDFIKMAIEEKLNNLKREGLITRKLVLKNES